MASATKVWTVADLADLPDDGNRYEVIDGELHVTPAPTSPVDVTFSEKRGVQPDLFVAPEGGAEPLTIDVERYFGDVLDD